MTEQEFVQFVKDECKYYGVKCSLNNTKQCYLGKGKCSGFFNQDTPELRVAMLNDVWLPTLVHEYCHLRQWIEKEPIWVKCIEEKSYEAWDKMATISQEELDYHLSNIRDLELDNEKRSVAMIKKLKLPIDVKEYTKKANSYVMFYNYMKVSRKWCKTPPYKNKRIIEAMPSKFSMDYSKFPEWLETIFREEGF